MKSTTEQGTVRISKCNGDTFRIVDIEFAGRRGKVCRSVTVQAHCGFNSQTPCDVEHNMAIKLTDVKDFETALEFAELAKQFTGVFIHPYEEKSIRVQPAGFQDITLNNDKYSVTVGFEDFCAADLTDHCNDPRWISTSKQKKADYKKVYNFVKNNQEMLIHPEMTMGQFTRLVGEQTGVHGHRYCAVD